MKINFKRILLLGIISLFSIANKALAGCKADTCRSPNGKPYCCPHDPNNGVELFQSNDSQTIGFSYYCKSISGNPDVEIRINQSITRPGYASVDLAIDDKTYPEIVSFNYWIHNSLGHSRCPGSWSGMTLTPTPAGQNSFKTLLITTEEDFVSCGFASPDNLVLQLNGHDSTIGLKCERLAN